MRALTVLMIAVLPWPAAAYFQMDLMGSKNSPPKEAVQWTLADWLTQKSRMSLMDTWLALHRQVKWLEVIPVAGHTRYTLTRKDASGSASVSQDSQAYGLNIYLGPVSLAGEYERTSTDVESYGGAGGLRLLGLSAQSTSLEGRFGWRRRQDLRAGEIWENQYAEGELQLYIVRWFGIDGRYRYYFPSTSNLGTRLQGHSVQGGAFFELGLARLYANAFQEPMELSSGGNVTKESRDGYQAGVKLYF